MEIFILRVRGGAQKEQNNQREALQRGPHGETKIVEQDLGPKGDVCVVGGTSVNDSEDPGS
jgi:hypothetical protein